LKKANDGDFKIKYTVSRFGAINDEDYVQTYYQVSAYYIGIGLTLDHMDKTGKVIYKDIQHKVNMFVTDQPVMKSN
jgi:hypothetical protein